MQKYLNEVAGDFSRVLHYSILIFLAVAKKICSYEISRWEWKGFCYSNNIQYFLERLPNKCAPKSHSIIIIKTYFNNSSTPGGPYSILLKANVWKPSDLQKDVLSGH